MNYIEGVFIYIILLFVIWFYSKTHRPNDQSKLCTFAFILLSLFAGLSYDVGWDYLTYRDAIINGNIERFEYLERGLMRISKNSPQLFFLINHTAIVGFTMWVINKYSTDKLLSIFVFICFPFQFLFGLSTIRASLMVSMVFWGYEYFLKERNKPLMYVIVILVGFFVHQASLAGILLLVVHYLKIGRWGNLSIILLSFFASFINEHLNLNFLSGISMLEDMSDKMEYYIEEEYGGGQMIHYCFLIISAVGVMFYKKIERFEDVKIYLTMVTIGYFISALFQQSPVLASRFSKFFYVFCILLIPYYVYILPKELQRVSKNFILCVLTALLLYQLSIHNYNGNDFDRINTYWPYKTIFSSASL